MSRDFHTPSEARGERSAKQLSLSLSQDGGNTPLSPRQRRARARSRCASPPHHLSLPPNLLSSSPPSTLRRRRANLECSLSVAHARLNYATSVRSFQGFSGAPVALPSTTTTTAAAAAAAQHDWTDCSADRRGWAGPVAPLPFPPPLRTHTHAHTQKWRPKKKKVSPVSLGASEVTLVFYITTRTSSSYFCVGSMWWQYGGVF